MPETEDVLAVLFSDIRGFTAYTARAGDRQALRLARRFTDLVAERVENRNGQIVKTYGDGVMTEFPDAISAALSASEMQLALQAHNRSESDQNLSAGIGITWGGAIRTEGDLFGHNVNLAKRVSDVAKGGQILVSESAAAEIRSSDSIQLRSLPRRDLTGLGDESLFEVVWRKEHLRCCTGDDRIELILTGDGTLAIEFGKEIETQLAEARRKLEDEAEESGWISRRIKRFVARQLETTVPGLIERTLERRGIGLEHPLSNVALRLEKDALAISVAEHKPLRIELERLDSAELEGFVEAFRNAQRREQEGETTQK